ncbi:MAG: DNA helicase [Gammaproteobacteria bacterium]|nr:MAG: DNA helicase [Gammaproteobacteria bacterium]
MTEHAGLRLITVPYGADPLAALAAHILQHTSSPGEAVIFLPHLAPADRLREKLLQQAAEQGLPVPQSLQLDTLRGWVERHVPLNREVLSGRARTMLLLRFLLDHPGLLSATDPLPLAEHLLALFDEITLRGVALAGGLTQFTAQLAQAYGIGSKPPAGLGEEARLLYNLWRAWHEESESSGRTDSARAYLAKLAAAADHAPPGAQIYLAGFHDFLPAERAFILALSSSHPVSILVHGAPDAEVSAQDYHPDAPLVTLFQHFGAGRREPPAVSGHAEHFTRFIASVYAKNNAAIAERARDFAQRHPHSPAAGRLRLYAAHGLEQEARALELQVRLWLQEGKTRIAVVSEDRRLARRVRALLERAGIALQDRTGWALSTSSAAAALENWLQSLEQNFAHASFFDLLRSPFIWPEVARGELFRAVYHLEQKILAARVTRDLARYRAVLDGVGQGEAELNDAAERLLDQAQHAAAPLLAMLQGGKHYLVTLLNALRESMQRLGMTAALEHDAAGKRLLSEMEHLRAATPQRTLPLAWPEFRRLLTDLLERAHFVPSGDAQGCTSVAGERTPGPVSLLTLEQTALEQFDALAIGAATRDQMPGITPGPPFFNSAVRAQLGLPTPHDIKTVRFHQFRRTLEIAPHVLITYCRELRGEVQQACPWVEAILAFHRLAYHTSLVAGISAPSTPEAAAPPRPLAMPRPACRAELLPQSLSAHAYQQLMDCPYQFHASRCLALSPALEAREEMEKADYGLRVHRILHAFHHGVAGLPGPFDQPVTAATRAAAIALLEEISHALFAADLKTSFAHRAWLKQWLSSIPHYIEWQIARETGWCFDAAEVALTRADLCQPHTLNGRLDRMDRRLPVRRTQTGGDELAIVDYKTGVAPKQQDVIAGEAVQLPFYSWLAGDRVTRVEYLLLEKDGVSSGACVEGEELTGLRDQAAARFVSLVATLHAGAELPAWGDARTCARCDMQGVCRKQVWSADHA